MFVTAFELSANNYKHKTNIQPLKSVDIHYQLITQAENFQVRRYITLWKEKCQLSPSNYQQTSEETTT
jgi:hypothetical protein